ncbi:MAG: YegP family protein, partial [Gammaproteobacteria bacterium]
SDGRHYFVLKATNGQVVGQSQMYKTESGCANGIASVTKNAPDAAVVEA